MVYAGMWRRIAAFSIDATILTLLICGFYFSMQYFMHEDYLETALLVFGLTICPLYSICFIASNMQATPGQRALHLKVVNRAGDSLSVFNIVLRYLLFDGHRVLLSIYMVIPSTVVVLTFLNKYLHMDAGEARIKMVLDYAAIPNFQEDMMLMFSTFFAVYLLTLLFTATIPFTREKKAIYDMVSGARVIHDRT